MTDLERDFDLFALFGVLNLLLGDAVLHPSDIFCLTLISLFRYKSLSYFTAKSSSRILSSAIYAGAVLMVELNLIGDLAAVL